MRTFFFKQELEMEDRSPHLALSGIVWETSGVGLC